MARPAGHRLSPEAWADWITVKGTTLTRVAELADIPRPTLSALLAGNSRASVPVAFKIADTVGCNPITLFPTLSPLFEERQAA